MLKRCCCLLLFLYSCMYSIGQTTIAIVADKDNTIFSTYPDNSNGAGEYFFVGKNSALNQNSVQRALIHFDLSSIPAGAIISAATLTVYVNKSGPNPTGIELRKLATDWGEGTSDAAGNEASGVATSPNDASWIKSITPSTAWATPGGNFSTTASSSVSTIGGGLVADAPVSLTGQMIITDIQNWRTNPTTNFGWAIISNDEAIGASIKRFISRNSLQTLLRPTLSITYAASLPISITSFSAASFKEDAVLKWITSTEVDNEYFDIEHSYTGRDFSSIARVKGNGNSTIECTYNFVHENVGAGKHFYRLAQIDKSGNRTYSPVIAFFGSTIAKLHLYPNPATSSLSISASSLFHDNEFTITSQTGQLVMKGLINNQQIDVQRLPVGQYWFSVKTDSGDFLKAQFLKR